jgi:hypothetical protein
MLPAWAGRSIAQTTHEAVPEQVRATGTAHLARCDALMDTPTSWQDAHHRHVVYEWANQA